MAVHLLLNSLCKCVFRFVGGMRVQAMCCSVLRPLVVLLCLLMCRGSDDDSSDSPVYDEALAPPVRAVTVAVVDSQQEVVAVLQAAWCGGDAASPVDVGNVQVRMRVCC